MIFVIMTDGLENSSREFTKSQVKEMIQEQQSKYNWHFTFLGADQDAFAEAGGLGIAAAGAAQFSKGNVLRRYLRVPRPRLAGCEDRQGTAKKLKTNLPTKNARDEVASGCLVAAQLC